MQRFATAPLDVVKIRMQLQSHRTAFHLRRKSPGAYPVKYAKIFPALKTIFKEEGVRVRSVQTPRDKARDLLTWNGRVYTRETLQPNIFICCTMLLNFMHTEKWSLQ